MLTDVLSPTALMPPGPMRLQVAGTDHEEWFHASGRLSCEAFETALSLAGHNLQEFRSVLDFGCGVGRVLRWLRVLMPDARFAASEIDAAALAWVGDHYPDVDLALVRNDGLPPVPLDDGRFDLVLGYSVFTHLNADYQDAWLGELQRLVRPGGMLLLSISGPRMLDHTLGKSDVNVDGLLSQLDAFAASGILHWRGEGWEQHFPDYYHTTFHSHAYVRRHWSRWFDVLNIYSGSPPEMPQDIVVLRNSLSKSA